MIKTIVRFIQTIKYLRITQIYHRLYYKIPARIKAFRKSYSVRNELGQLQTSNFLTCSTTDGITFCLLNQTFDVNQIYQENTISKLWMYNFHYHSDLVFLSINNPKLGLSLISSWIKNNSDPLGLGWEPYCISIRSVNWIKFLTQFSSFETKEFVCESLFLQVSFLERRLEKNILANHLFSNAKALIFAGSYFDGIYAERWLHKGLKILDKEIEEQFLEDGGHYERSPMYHCLMLWDLADLINLAKTSNLKVLKCRQRKWASIFVKGMDWLNKIIHPDGEISFFNDSTFGVAPTIEDLKAYQKKLIIEDFPKPHSDSLSFNMLVSSGFASVEWLNGNKLICDIGNIAPSYQPGHSHAGTLSCELSINSQRILVNSGISTYERSDLRHLQRSTQSHNTASIDFLNSSDVWSSFRVAKRAFITEVSSEESNEKVRISAAHNGFRKMFFKRVHSRTWQIESKSLKVIDEVTGGMQNFQIFWHFHPTVKVRKISEKKLCVSWQGNNKIYFETSSGDVELLRGSWYPGFNIEEQNTKVIINSKKSKIESTIYWI